MSILSAKDTITVHLTKKHLNKAVGHIHFWMTIFGGFEMVILFKIIGMEGALHREAILPAAFQWACHGYFS
jgi:heme/copper-type cytochrome/quinol oxidase subunit 1